jgi:methionine-gamma-lyase
MMPNERCRGLHRNTRAIHAGALDQTIYGEVTVPIFQTSTFSFPSAEEGAARFAGTSQGYIYSRLNNPTVSALEECITCLENGFAGMATASGMAAVTTVFLTFLEQGAHVVATDSIYGTSRVLLEKELGRFGVSATFVNSSDLASIEAALQDNTRLLYIETPTNPTMQITDLEATAAIARNHALVLVVDNTFASPYLQRPLELGADVVLHSLTKYLNGHCDVVGGIIVTRGEEHFGSLRSMLNIFGGVMDPHQAWLVLRGIRTLPLRMERAQENAMKLAEWLSGHAKVTWVCYPGLRDHPQYTVANKQMDGFGAMISFGVKNGLEGGRILMNSVRLIILAVSLGGVESLIEHPASMTHAALPREDRERAGISDDLVRFSVGCEAFEDLRDDLDQALNRIA